ncbi:MAG TPA: septum formation initiator family protein [Flavisolibacter sp.]|nr:septum formation initiator family protein [Flavisolibacter sp.]
MALIKRIPAFLRNKFLLAGMGFVIWMLFFDKNDVFTQLEWKQELREMQASKAYFIKQIEENRQFSNELQFNAAAVEKFAREKYLMKKDNEEIFLVRPAEAK